MLCITRAKLISPVFTRKNQEAEFAGAARRVKLTLPARDFHAGSGIITKNFKVEAMTGSDS